MEQQAIVTRVFGAGRRRRVWVDYLGEAVPCACRLKGGLLLRGDAVRLERLPDSTYAVAEVLPRRGIMRLGLGSRGLARRERRSAPALANVEQIIEIREAGGAAALPPSRPGVLVVFSKCDRSDETEVLGQAARLAEAGASVVVTSAISGRGLPELRRRLEGRVSALVGGRGAGKSCLLEALYPGYGLRENQEELRPLPGGGYLAL